MTLKCGNLLANESVMMMTTTTTTTTTTNDDDDDENKKTLFSFGKILQGKHTCSVLRSDPSVLMLVSNDSGWISWLVSDACTVSSPGGSMSSPEAQSDEEGKNSR